MRVPRSVVSVVLLLGLAVAALAVAALAQLAGSGPIGQVRSAHAGVASCDLVVNGSFESPQLAAGAFGEVTPSGWSGTARVSNGPSNDNRGPTAGNQFLYGIAATLSQEVPTAGLDGQRLTASFDLRTFSVAPTVTLGGNSQVFTSQFVSARLSLTYVLPDPAPATTTISFSVSNPDLDAVSVTASGCGNQPPVISSDPPDVGPVEATGPAGAEIAFALPQATDPNPDDTVTVNCDPGSGSTFGLGTTTVTCTATDIAGATDTATFTVTVVDTTAPALSLPDPITAEATSPAGAAVTYTATATDLVDGTVAMVCAPPSGSTFPIGTTTVTCTATDDVDNTVTGSFTIRVRDRTGPVITWVGGPQPNTTYTQATLPAAPTCTATDTSSAVVQCRVYGYSTAPGRYTLTARAWDGAGNATVSTRSYTVTAGAPTATPRPATATPRPTVAPPAPTATPRPTVAPPAPTATPRPTVAPPAPTATPVRPVVRPTATPVAPVVQPEVTPTRPPRR